jgi:hypothetical protein
VLNDHFPNEDEQSRHSKCPTKEYDQQGKDPVHDSQDSSEKPSPGDGFDDRRH